MKYLDQKIVNKLSKDLGLAPKTIKNNVYKLAEQYPNASPNALAQFYARKMGISILRMLDDEDRKVFPTTTKSFSEPAPMPRIIRIGKAQDQDRWYNNWLVQVVIAFLVSGILAQTIAQVLGIWIAKSIGLQ